MMDSVDGAAQLELYLVDDLQPMQLDEAWRDIVNYQPMPKTSQAAAFCIR